MSTACRSCSFVRDPTALRRVCVNRTFHQVMCERCLASSTRHGVELRTLGPYEPVLGSAAKLWACDCRESSEN